MSSTTQSSRCREPAATYRLNATGISFEYLRKYIASYVDGASVRGSIRREDGQEYYLYDADRPLVPSEVRDILADSSEFTEARQRHHRRNWSGSSRARRSRRPRDAPTSPAVIQVNGVVNVNIMPNAHQNTSTISYERTASADQARHLGFNVRTPAPPYSPAPSHRQIPQQQQQPPPLPSPSSPPSQQQPSVLYTPAGTPSLPELVQPIPLNCKAASAHSWSPVSAVSTPKTL